MHTEILLRVFPDLLFVYRWCTLLATGRDGWISDGADGLQGLYESDTRLLSRYRLLVNGRAPRLNSLSAVDSYSTLGYYVCPPIGDAEEKFDALGLSSYEIDRQVVITVARFAGKGLREETEITNHGLTPAKLHLMWELDADFAGLTEARSGTRQQSAPVESAWREDLGGEGGIAELRFDYGHPQLSRGVSPALRGRRSCFQLRIEQPQLPGRPCSSAVAADRLYSHAGFGWRGARASIRSGSFDARSRVVRLVTRNPQPAIRAQHSRKSTAHCADGKTRSEDHEHIRNPQR